MLGSPNRLIALALGIAFAAYGVVAAVGGRFLFAGVLVVAAAILVTCALIGITPARRANLVAGTVWLGLGLAGLFLIGTPLNILGLNSVDEVALFAAATVQLAVALGARRDPATRDRQPRDQVTR